jgi:hypothetical protein
VVNATVHVERVLGIDEPGVKVVPVGEVGVIVMLPGAGFASVSWVVATPKVLVL